MNAPLPLKISREAAAQAYDDVARVSNEVAGRLAARLAAETQGEVLFSPADRGRYATDASIYQVTPVGVFVPRTDADVKTALDICRDLQVPIVPRGGGTSQCGQTVGAGLVIDHAKHLRNILAVDPGERTAEVQPGIVLDHLNASLKQHGLWYPVDVSTSAQATLGGMAGNNSCGSRSIAYGNMVHNVLGASAWRSDGSLLELGRYDKAGGAARELGDYVKTLSDRLRPELEAHWPKVLRRVAGYNLDIFNNQNEKPYAQDGSVNLAHLLVGSEGTLALTKSLTLRLAELPRTKVLGVVNFPTFYKAMDTAQHIVKLGGDGMLSAVELVDRTMIELSLQNPAFAPTVRTALIGQPDAILLVEFSGNSKAELAPKMRQLVELMGDLGLPGSVVEMMDDAPQKNLWEVRKAGLNIMMSLKGDGKPVSFIEDCAVPLEHLAEYTDALTNVFRKYGSKGTWYAHASVGTLHVRPILDMRREGGAKMRAIAEEASALVRHYKGAYSGEHGDGLCRGEWIEWQFGRKINEAFAQIKNYLDPLNLLSPNRIINPPKMDDTRLMRFPPSYKVIPIKTALDWSAWDVQNDPVTEQTSEPGTGGDPAQGFAKAVEMCNNNGHCRKFDTGTMCPSYRATRDEKHLTRGRANTLRLALSGQLDGLKAEDAFTSEAVQEAMDLCVGCKGCKRDCPTGVDMAKMKVEFLHHYKAKHGYTLKDRLVAHLPDYAHWASRFAPLLNLRDKVPGLAAWSEKILGLSARRTLPQWRSNTFWKRLGAQAEAGAAPPGRIHTASREEVLAATKPVVLFVDTFNGYFESENAWAALRVLQAGGYTVHVAAKTTADGKSLCCGRTYLAGGMVDKAKAKAREVVGALLPFAERGIAIVGLEPSCLLTLRDEMLVMGLGEAAQTISRHALLLEEFLVREAAGGKLEMLKGRLKPAAQPILLHGHCHQKAFGAVSPILDVLRLIPGAQPELIESSCCGMAGSFGYEAGHYEVSMQMAELSLLPAVRKQPDAIVVADGTSCRHQIKDGAQREAIHVAVLLARQLQA
ncbi:FAD-binding and (Fe-S)-binding domain-containing protein [Polaromonas sp. JS666]|uniref:FAD-binding and (Fe-S)-binding domain-containing protein n=1 Tax=Polaromonas sp. (strain JS666 / ATCC BAA-500) TaxID=296591 RepID=UPI00088093D6|nr:FAD-binding and (Fe-S)-binding domain-containing protein [Polaromonas sp. JS666]SDM55555.1 FAD/FMN-containing dehydrogenase [Polaromonas sp. JS666]